MESSVRGATYSVEQVFPSLKARLSAALLDQVDVALELSTLGSYGLADDRWPLALDGVEREQVTSSFTRGPAATAYAAETPRRAAPPRRKRDRCSEDAVSTPQRERRGGSARP